MPIDWSRVLVRDVMRRRVATLGPDDSLRDAAELFVERGVSGAPVVDDDGRVLGVLSQSDLLRHANEAALSQLPPFYLEGSEIRVARQVPSHDLSPVREAMSRDVVSVEEDVPVTDVAGLMVERGMHRVLVTRGGELKGIVSTLDLARLVAGPARPPSLSRPPRASARRAGRPISRSGRGGLRAASAKRGPPARGQARAARR